MVKQATCKPSSGSLDRADTFREHNRLVQPDIHERPPAAHTRYIFQCRAYACLRPFLLVDIARLGQKEFKMRKKIYLISFFISYMLQ